MSIDTPLMGVLFIFGIIIKLLDLELTPNDRLKKTQLSAYYFIWGGKYGIFR